MTSQPVSPPLPALFDLSLVCILKLLFSIAFPCQLELIERWHDTPAPVTVALLLQLYRSSILDFSPRCVFKWHPCPYRRRILLIGSLSRARARARQGQVLMKPKPTIYGQWVWHNPCLPFFPCNVWSLTNGQFVTESKTFVAKIMSNMSKLRSSLTVVTNLVSVKRLSALQSVAETPVPNTKWHNTKCIIWLQYIQKTVYSNHTNTNIQNIACKHTLMQ